MPIVPAADRQMIATAPGLALLGVPIGIAQTCCDLNVLPGTALMTVTIPSARQCCPSQEVL